MKGLIGQIRYHSAPCQRQWEILRTYIPAAFFLTRLMLRWWKIRRDPNLKSYSDIATKPVENELEEDLEMFEVTEAARNMVAKAKERTEKLAHRG